MISRPVYCRRFIGRRTHLEVLLERSLEARSGHGSAVLIAGEAGIGKTRLLAEARIAFERDGGRAATGQCYQYVPSPFAPFADALRELDRNAPEVLQSAHAVSRALAPLLRENEDGSAPAVARDDGKRTLFDGVVDGLRLFAARSPVLVAIEDLHWADPGTLEVLLHLAPLLAPTRIVLVGTYRSDELHRRHPLRSALAKLERNANLWRIELEPLDDADVFALIAYSLEDPGALQPEISEAVCRLAEGNPFFAEELLKSALDASDGARGTQLPLSLAQAVLERASALGEEDRYVLNCAALLDRSCTPELLARITGRGENEIVEVIKRAVGLQLLTEDVGADVRYGFRHALTREIFRDELLVTEQRALHARIATIVEALPTAHDHVADLAHHYYEAHNFAKAAQYNLLAANAAAALGAYEDASRCYERALEGTPDAAQRGRLYESLAKMLYYRGLGERARRAYEDAIGIHERTGEAAAATQACLEYSRLCFNLGDSATAYELVNRALAFVEAYPQNPLRFAAHTNLAGLHAMLGKYDEALEQLRIADKLPVKRNRVDEQFYYEYRCVATAMRGEVQASAQDCATAVAVARELGDVLTVNRVLGNFGEMMGDLSERDLALESLEKALHGFRSHDIRGTVYATFLIQYANVHYDLSDLSKARRAVGDALAMPVQRKLRAELAAVAIPVGIALQEPEIIERFADADLLEHADSYADMGLTRFCAALIQLFESRNDHNSSCRLLTRLLEAPAASEPVPLADPWIFVQAAALGDAAAAIRARETLQRMSTISPRRDMPAHVRLVDAWIAKRDSRPDEAVALAQDAADVFRIAHRPYRQAQALELAGKRREALDIYASVGDVYDARRVESVLTPVNRRGRPKTALTRRELEVAALVAQGKTNRVIADTLIVGERTVETHVASILSKIGAASRAEIAAFVARGNTKA